MSIIYAEGKNPKLKPGPKPRPIEDRFWEKVDKRGGEECWKWTGAFSSGYGHIGDGFKGTIYAHRLSWIIHNGLIPDKLKVLHNCDNPSCVNPNHLYLGTQGDNMYDRAMRNPNNQGGEPLKFNSKEAQLIRELYLTGEYNRVSLALKFSCNPTTISNIVNKKGAYTERGELCQRSI